MWYAAVDVSNIGEYIFDFDLKSPIWEVPVWFKPSNWLAGNQQKTPFSIEFCGLLWQMSFANGNGPFELRNLKQNLSIFYLSDTKGMRLRNDFYEIPISIYKEFCFLWDIPWFNFIYDFWNYRQKWDRSKVFRILFRSLFVNLQFLGKWNGLLDKLQIRISGMANPAAPSFKNLSHILSIPRYLPRCFLIVLR